MKKAYVAAFFVFMIAGTASASLPKGEVYGGAELRGGHISVDSGEQGEWIAVIDKEEAVRAVQVNGTVRGGANLSIQAISGNRIVDRTNHRVRDGSATYKPTHPAAERTRLVVKMRGPVTIRGVSLLTGRRPITTGSGAMDRVLIVAVAAFAGFGGLVWRRWRREKVIGDRWEPSRVEHGHE